MSTNPGNLSSGLANAISEVKEAIKASPFDPDHRAAYFQLLCLGGDWVRAKDQLRLVEEMEPNHAMFAQVYSRALMCEEERAQVMKGESAPVVFGEPPEWIALLIEAFRLGASGDWAAAAKLQEQAFEKAPAVPGRVNGQEVAWISDADSRFGPVLEAFIEGHYRWIPFERIQSLTIATPKHIVDSVWMPVTFVWTNGGQVDGLVPARYSGSENSEAESIKIGRRTEWEQKGENFYIGLGQRMFATDQVDIAALDLREVQMGSGVIAVA